MKRTKWPLYAGLGLVAAALAAAGWFFIGTGGPYYDAEGRYTRLTASSSFGHAEGHPAFAAYADFIIPWKDPVNRTLMPLQSLRSVCLMNRADTGTVVEAFNWMIDREEAGEAFYYDFLRDGTDDTGLIWLPSADPDAPLAVVVPGGGLTVVCVYTEGFPIARELWERGYNVAILKYRVSEAAGGEAADAHMARQLEEANRTFAAAMGFLFETPELTFDRGNYAVWGFSAGGLLCHLWGMSNDFGCGQYGIPAPTAAVLAYSGWYDEAFAADLAAEPPTFFACCRRDDVIGRERNDSIHHTAEALASLGVPVEYHAYDHAAHGFGVGRHTGAEGWIDTAVAFWRTQSGGAWAE